MITRRRTLSATGGLAALAATGPGPVMHIAIQEALDGKTVDWMEKVSDEQYRA